MKTTIRIAPADAALVIRRDGTIESWLPNPYGDPPPNALAASALMCAYTDERLMTMLLDAMEAGEPPRPELEPVQ